MPPRFYLPGLVAGADRATLPEDEALHLTRVLRLGAGDDIDVFDGRGGMWRARVAEARRAHVMVDVGAAIAAAPELKIHAALAGAVLKGDRMDAVVRDAAMIGVHEIQPLVTEYTDVPLAALARSRRTERWQRIAVASVKQCGRAVVPVVHEPVTIATHLARPAIGLRVVLVEPSTGVVEARQVRALAPATAVECLVGPEGGWTPEEVQSLLAAGAVPVALGGRTLRADAVPLAAFSALLAVWDAW